MRVFLGAIALSILSLGAVTATTDGSDSVRATGEATKQPEVQAVGVGMTIDFDEQAAIESENLAVEEYLEAIVPKPPPPPPVQTPHIVLSAPGEPRPTAPYADAAECTRAHEGWYTANTGNGYYGAYQFLLSTWNNTVRAMGREDLVGVLPSDAAPADQDAAFWFLWNGGAGASHWGGRCLEYA